VLTSFLSLGDLRFGNDIQRALRPLVWNPVLLPVGVGFVAFGFEKRRAPLGAPKRLGHVVGGIKKPETVGPCQRSFAIRINRAAEGAF